VNIFIVISLTALGASLLKPLNSERFRLQISALLISLAVLAVFIAGPAPFEGVFAVAVTAIVSWLVATPQRRSLNSLLALFIGFLSIKVVERVSSLIDKQIGFSHGHELAVAIIAAPALCFATALGGATGGTFAWLGIILGSDHLITPWPLTAFSYVALPVIVALDARHSPLALGLLAANISIFLIGGTYD
jgi:hypothetical protein